MVLTGLGKRAPEIGSPPAFEVATKQCNDQQQRVEGSFDRNIVPCATVPQDKNHLSQAS